MSSCPLASHHFLLPVNGEGSYYPSPSAEKVSMPLSVSNNVVFACGSNLPWLILQCGTRTSSCLIHYFSLSTTPTEDGPPKDFHRRDHSDRYEHGTKPILLKHARVWTGERNGTDIIRGDILLDKGLIKAVGHVPRSSLEAFNGDLVVIDVQNAWVTPGIVDIHSHIGDSATPELVGASGDYNSNLGNIQPWLRSLDGLNTRDRSYELSISGGSYHNSSGTFFSLWTPFLIGFIEIQVLPGSGNAIGSYSLYCL